MRLHFDESGDFAFGAGFDAYVQAAVICAERDLPKIEAFVAAEQDRLGVDELHGVALPDEELVPICAYVEASPLEILAQATDTNALTEGQITEHRLGQAVRLKENLEQWKAAGGESESIESWYWLHINRAGLPQRVSNREYVQADFLVRLIHGALFKTIVRFLDDRYRDDLADFHFILDGKLPGKLAAGEKVLNALLLPAMGSNQDRFALVTPLEWQQEPVHPFHAKFSSGENTLSLNRIFEHGLRFEDSRDHAGLQLADVVAYVTRRAILDPDDDVVYRAYSHIRDKLRTERGGQAISLVRYETGTDNIDDARYRLVL